ncbi:hypothetical protein C7974DRAFT_427574 [Boeremia exigua]|uniref:uncharacterized protein n=1 Tax=Boeremia exigua TaxID=749465 RepID=UPI001E8E163F|nr:uncharacterized protein C7974DRAFT_427574 [Boeremia exigua]KAH6616621.1 hypothetical protein C7974DRAFT_427574 [Boeremia exigua]
MFYMNDYCEAQQPDGLWYRGTIQGGPYTATNGRAYYRVHVHHPLNKHEMIWEIFLRPEADDYSNNETVFHFHANGHTVTMGMNQMMGIANRFRGPPGGATGLLAPQVPAAQPIVPLKRPLDASQVPITPSVKAEVVRPTLSKPSIASKSVGTPTAGPAAKRVASTSVGTSTAEPTAKRIALQPSSITGTSTTPVQAGGGVPFMHARPSPALLEGSAIKVRVRPGIIQDSRIWCLPKALLSKYSPFFKATFHSTIDANGKTAVNLDGFEPSSFTDFVQWMYYGSRISTADRDSWADIDAWLLGDKLEVPGFQNAIMGDIYTHHTALADHPQLRSVFVDHLCMKTGAESPLRLFFLDLLAQQFSRHDAAQEMLQGWEVVFQKHADVRSTVVQPDSAAGPVLKKRECYMVDTNCAKSGGCTQLATVIVKAEEGGPAQSDAQTHPRVKVEIKQEPNEA